jgi:hypothetical protein
VELWCGDDLRELLAQFEEIIGNKIWRKQGKKVEPASK